MLHTWALVMLKLQTHKLRRTVKGNRGARSRVVTYSLHGAHGTHGCMGNSCIQAYTLS